MKKVAILQSNYIPWKGYFDMINEVDEFIYYDEMQYTRNDWRNRNMIKTPNGTQWLTIPVASKGYQSGAIRIIDATITDPSWSRKHWLTLQQNYKKAPFFNKYKDIFADLYSQCSNEQYLCSINYLFIKAINEILGITTKISYSTDYNLIEGKTERLLNLVMQAGGSEYLSGPAAKGYIDPSLFEQAGIKLSWMDYSGYEEYPQLYANFEHGVSILDLLFNCGESALSYMKAGRN